MNFDLAVVEKNRRHWIVVLRVDRRDLFVNGGFAHARDAQHAPHDTQGARASAKTLGDVVFKHRTHLARWSRQEHDRGAVMIDEHAGRGAVWVWQYDGVFDDHRLARVSFGH